MGLTVSQEEHSGDRAILGAIGAVYLSTSYFGQRAQGFASPRLLLLTQTTFPMAYYAAEQDGNMESEVC